MGPRSIDRGIEPGIYEIGDIDKLQWGRDQLIAEFCPAGPVCSFLSRASMGPRSIDRGIRDAGDSALADGRASMGPRSIDRGIGRLISELRWKRRASMGPRSIDRGIIVFPEACRGVDAGFNGAAIN